MVSQENPNIPEEPQQIDQEQGRHTALEEPQQTEHEETQEPRLETPGEIEVNDSEEPTEIQES